MATEPKKVTHLSEVRGRDSAWMREHLCRVADSGVSLDHAVLIVPETGEVIHCCSDDLAAIGFLECMKQRLIDGLRNRGDAP